MNGTDQWYIRPSAWARINQDRARRIENDLYECSGNIGMALPYSILDDLRRDLLAELATLNLSDDGGLATRETNKLSAVLPHIPADPHF